MQLISVLGYESRGSWVPVLLVSFYSYKLNRLRVVGLKCKSNDFVLTQPIGESLKKEFFIS